MGIIYYVGYERAFLSLRNRIGIQQVCFLPWGLSGWVFVLLHSLVLGDCMDVAEKGNVFFAGFFENVTCNSIKIPKIFKMLNLIAATYS